MYMKNRSKVLYMFFVSIFYLICMLIPVFYLIFSITEAACRNRVNLGLTGYWNNDFGGLNAVKVVEVVEEDEYYAYCTSSKGLVIFSIKQDSADQSVEASLKSFIPLGNCQDIMIIEDEVNEEDIYIYITCGDAGLSIIRMNNHRFQNCMATCMTRGFAQGIAMAGDLAYVADGEDGLVIIDMRDKKIPAIAGYCNIPGFASGVAIAGEYAYVASGYNGLQIIDISNPKNPRIMASCDTPDFAQNVCIKGDYAYIADGWSGLVVIDIGNANWPEIVGGCDTPWSAQNVTIKEAGAKDYAYVADGGSGLVVVDISDPNRPEIVGSCDTPGFARDIALAGRYLCIADGDEGLQVIDITSQKGPVIMGSCNTPGIACGIALAGDYIYLADGDKGLQVIDISNRRKPEIIGGCKIPHNMIPSDVTINDVVATGDYAYVTEGDEIGLRVIDISDKKSPRPVGACYLPGHPQRMAINGDYVYVNGGGVQIIDISARDLPEIVGSCDTPGGGFDIAVAGDYAYIADGWQGLSIVDITNTENPEFVGGCDVAFAQGVAVAGGYAFVTIIDSSLNSSLQVIDINDPNHPEIVGSCGPIGSAYYLAIEGNYAFVAGGFQGLFVIDISDANRPEIVGSCDTPDSAYDILAAGEYAYIADLGMGLQVIDASNSKGPIIKESYTVQGFAYDVNVTDNYAYVANDDMGLLIIDITNENGEQIMKGCDILDSARSVAISGNYAYLADYYKGLRIIDLSPSGGPEITGYCYIPGTANDMAIDGNGNYAYVVDSIGLHIIEIKDKESPEIVTTWKDPMVPQGLAIAGDYAYVVDYYRGLQIVDISDPYLPERTGSCPTPGHASDIDIKGNYAYVADGAGGLQVIDISEKRWPKIVGSLDIPGYAKVVAIVKDYAFMVVDDERVLVIDIKDPKNPAIVSSYDTYGPASDFFAAGDYVYMAAGTDGLLKLKADIGPQPKSSLILLAGGNMDYRDSYWQSIQVLANKIYDSYRNQGLEVYDIYYINSLFFRGIENGGFPDQLMIDDLTPTKEGEGEGFNYALTNRAAEEDLNTGPLYIFLIGHGDEDLFQIMPNEILKAKELKDYINTFKTNNLANPADPTQTSPRTVVLILESAASGSFIDDLADPNNPYQNTIVITSTGLSGPSYIKPSFDPNNPLPISFAGLLIKQMQNYSLEDLGLLQEAFIDAREDLYYTHGLPFLDQAPQMYIPGGPIAISLIPEDPNLPYDINLPEAPIIINQEATFTLITKARYPDGSTITLDPNHLIFLSSRIQVFDPSDPNQLKIDPDNTDHILIHPARARNGLCTLIAYPNPDYYPDILLTARLPIEISIRGNTIAGGDKALIVAGYRANNGIPDNIWKSTNIIANHAYLSLRKKRYSHDDIFYLSPLYKQDVDQNGRYDDIDGYPRIEKIDWAINRIKKTGAEELLIFLVDHGYPEAFNLNPKKGEELTAQDLKERIISLAPSPEEEKPVQKTITLLIDACQSGSFITALQNSLKPQADPNQLIIITSTDPNENTQFFGDGLISFSYPFFDEYLLTNSILSAYQHASRFMSPIRQTPQISDTGIARKRDKALEYYMDEARPVITERAFSREGERLTITARVYSLSGIDRVWIIITSCEGPLPDPEGGPWTEEPADLIPDDPNAPYGGIYTLQINDPYPDAFNYQIILSAMDKTGKVVTERTNVNNQEKNTTGAIILVTDYTAAPSIAHAIDDKSHSTHLILKERHIRDDDIHNDIYYVKTKGDYPGERIDTAPASFDMEAISTWLQEGSYQVLLIYLIGESGYDAQGEVHFKLSQSHHICPSDLAAHIRTQEGCQVLLFCEMIHAREFINRFPLKPTWAAIASPYNEVPFFSSCFFSSLSFFDTVGEAFEKACSAFKEPRRPPSEYIYFHDLVPSSYGKISERLAYHLGNPKIPGEDPLLIKDTQVLEGTSTLTLRLRVNENARIKSPWAELLTPSGQISRSLLGQRDANISLWESPPLPKDKTYTRVSFYVEQVQDANQPGVIDWRERAITPFFQVTGKEPYEPNDTQEYAYPIVIDIPQRHTFHDTNDTDWVYFYAYNGEAYYITANDPIYGYFTRITLCDANGIMIQQEGFDNPFIIEQDWHCTQNGYYNLKVESAAAPEDIPFSYDLSVGRYEGPTPTADIQGRVVDQSHEGINGLVIYVQTDIYTRKTSTGSIKNIKRPPAYPAMNPAIKTEGWFFMENLLAPGSYKITVTAKDDPDTILAELSIYLYENNIHLIDDIVIVQDLLDSQKDPNKESISGFERAYKHWQEILGEQYIPWEDTDGDGFTNLEEFLNRTDPSDPYHPTLAYSLYPGLNLFPFHLTDPYWASDFCIERLKNKYHSFWGYNKEKNLWDSWYKDSGGTDFPLEKGKGYLIYKHTPEVIYQESHNSISFLTPGSNLIRISPIPKGDTYTLYTSFQFLRDRKKEGVKSISRYSHAQEGEYKSKGIWETSYLFFGRPAGVEFTILPNEAYLIEVNRENK